MNVHTTHRDPEGTAYPPVKMRCPIGSDRIRTIGNHPET